MRIRNLDIYPRPEDYERLVDEYQYLGYTVVRGEGKITVLALPPRKEKKEKHDNKPRRRETKRDGARV